VAHGGWASSDAESGGLRGESARVMNSSQYHLHIYS
jgi:hypothetical protein